MTDNRIKNSTRNLFFGLLKYAVTILFPFIIRSVLIYKLGAEYAGISSLFSSILQVLSLSELGFSTAVVFALYKPVANNETEKICQLMSFFRTVYRYIGIFILLIGTVICPFIKHFVSGFYPDDINIFVIFILLLVNTSISYLLCGYKSVLFSANQRDDILSKCTIYANLVMYSVELMVLVIFSSYYGYIVAMFVGTVLNNALMYKYSRKMYPKVSCRNGISKSEKIKLIKSVGTLFGHQLDTVVITSADNIVISMYLGLTTVTIYNNYYLILNSLLGFLIMISNSFANSIGNSIAIETKEKNYKNFIDFTYFIGMISAICTILMFVLYQDFMKIWMGDGMLLDIGVVFCLCLSFYVRQLRRSVITYKIAAGIWANDALKPYVGCLSNLILNIILVQVIGLYGVIISTIVSMFFIETPWEILVFFKGYFRGGIGRYLWTQTRIIIKMSVIGLFIVFVSNLVIVDRVSLFFLKCILLLIFTTALFVVVSFRDNEFKYIVDKIKPILVRRIGW